MQTLTILGTSVRAAAVSARKAGFSTYAIDHFADRDLAAACPAIRVESIRGFPAALGAAPAGPWMYTGGLENHPRLVEQLMRARPLLGNDGHVLRHARRIEVLAEASYAAACCFPSAKFRASANEQWLVKRRQSGGGLGIRFLKPGERGPKSRRFYVQQFIPGESASAVFVAAGGQTSLIGATRQLVGRDFGLADEFVYCGSTGPLLLTEFEATKLQKLGNLLAERCQLQGLFNIDFIRTASAPSASQLWPIELNPRYSASVEVLELATAANFIDLHVRACTGGSLPERALATNERFFGKAIVYAQVDSVVPSMLDEIMKEWNQPGQQPGIADLPQVGERLFAGQPVVTVFASGSSMLEVDEGLYRRVAAIQNLLSDGYRADQ